MKNILTFFSLCCLLLTAACFQNDGQFSGLFQQTFRTTPKCGMTDRVVSFLNTRDAPLKVMGIAMAPGTNGAGHFSLQSLQIGTDAEIPADVSGGINPAEGKSIIIQPAETYKLRVRYSPLEESGEGFHFAMADLAFTEGIQQVELYGRSEGEENCPDVIDGAETGLDGDVDVTVSFLVAATTALGVPISTDMGVVDFTPVTLQASITNGVFAFPQITQADDFALPEIDLTNPGTGPLRVLSGETEVTTDSAVTGTFDAQTGHLFLPDVGVTLADERSTLVFTLDFTTDSVDALGVPSDRLIAGGFQLDGGRIAGIPVQEDGSVHLVGAGIITEATGDLDAGIGASIAVRIEATILCPNGTTTCH